MSACVNDTDGDGNCAACAHNPEAPCRQGGQTERRDRYAAAMAAAEGHDWAELVAQYPYDVADYRKCADAVMAVADEERAPLLELISKLNVEIGHLRFTDEENARLRAAAPSTPADQNLRDRIRRAICEAEGFAWDTDMLEPDEYGDIADAVLAVLRRATQPEIKAAVLPAPADRAAVLREAIEVARQESERLAAEMSGDAAYGARAVAKMLRRMADEAQR